MTYLRSLFFLNVGGYCFFHQFCYVVSQDMFGFLFKLLLWSTGCWGDYLISHVYLSLLCPLDELAPLSLHNDLLWLLLQFLTYNPFCEVQVQLPCSFLVSICRGYVVLFLPPQPLCIFKAEEVSCRQCVVGSYFIIHSATPCLWIRNLIHLYVN